MVGLKSLIIGAHSQRRSSGTHKNFIVLLGIEKSWIRAFTINAGDDVVCRKTDSKIIDIILKAENRQMKHHLVHFTIHNVPQVSFNSYSI
jgi:hypothetical protein